MTRAARSASRARRQPRLTLSRFLGVCGLLPVIAIQVGCFFTTTLTVSFVGGAIFISGNSTMRTCQQTPSDPDLWQCSYASFGGEGATFGSSTTLTGLELAALLLLIDPVVVQLPAGASGFAASYSVDGGSQIPLIVTGGLSSVPADVNQAINAEPGTQLVTLELPPSTSTVGNFSWEFRFDPPTGATVVPIKAMFTGRVANGGTVYYPPLFPCTTNFGTIAATNITPLTTSSISLPLGNVGCNNAIYAFAAAVPALPLWSVVAMALLLLSLGAWRLSRAQRQAVDG